MGTRAVEFGSAIGVAPELSCASLLVEASFGRASPVTVVIGGSGLTALLCSETIGSIFPLMILSIAHLV